jgi:8-oxo-dGTP diphosphatase
MNDTHQRIAVYGLVLNDSGEILVVKRSLRDSHPGLWEMPGGALEYGDQPDKGALREIKEETNLDVELMYSISATSGFSKKNPNVQVIRIAFLCYANNPDSLVLSHEHIGYQWIKPHQITVSPLSEFLQATLKIISKYPTLITALLDK